MNDIKFKKYIEYKSKFLKAGFNVHDGLLLRKDFELLTDEEVETLMKDLNHPPTLKAVDFDDSEEVEFVSVDNEALRNVMKEHRELKNKKKSKKDKEGKK